MAGLGAAHDELRTLDRRRAAGVDDDEAGAGAGRWRNVPTPQVPAPKQLPTLQRPTAESRRTPEPPSRRRSTPTSTSASRTSSADRRTPSARGSRATCRYFDGASDVLDVGCGRGEFLDLLAARGISGARHRSESRDGRSLPRARARRRRSRRRRLPRRRCPTRRSADLFAAQVVEHLQPAYLLRFLELAFHKLRPGAPIVLETLNPACWMAFFDSFIRDITHVWPLHPETLRYLVARQRLHHGARSSTVRRSRREDRLQPVAAPIRRRPRRRISPRPSTPTSRS